MAGLNDLVTNEKTESTTLPSWYSTAQQDVVNKALSAASPAVGDTSAQAAIDALKPGNAFESATDILQQIGSGAANPWLVSTDATGKQVVTPNVNTALGGLYQSQRDYLNQIMPEIDVTPTAQAIAGGGFGSRMNLSGVANVRANALADLQQKQMTNALQAQQTGVAAATGLGNVNNQYVQSALNTGTYEQNAPYASALNTANIISKMQVPTTKTSSEQLGGLNQIIGLLSLTEGGLGSLAGGTVLKDASGKPILDANGKPIVSGGLLDQLKTIYNKITNTGQATGTPVNTSGWTQAGDTGYWYDSATGMVSDNLGNVYQDGKLIYSPYGDISLDTPYEDSESTEL